MKSRYLVTIIVFIVAAAALGGIYLRLQENSEDSAENSEESATVDSARAAAQSTAAASAFATGVAVPVEGAAVRRGTFVLWVTAEGQAAAMRRAPLHAQVGGPVIEVPVREGVWVSAGDVIARIDPVEYEISRKEAQGALEQAEASYQDLTLGDETIDDPEVLAVRQGQARIRSGLAGAEARLEQAEYNLEKTVIRAPYSGRVANLVVDVGTRLSVNDSVATVVDLSSIEVDVQVLESEIAALEVGRDAAVTFTAFPGEEFQAVVVTVNPVVDPVSHVGRATVRLRNPGARILPGMHANVRVAGRLFEDRVSVPKEAIVERSRREVVFVFEPEDEGASTGRAKWRYVTTGLENEEAIEVVSSEDTDELFEGEIVLVGGHTTLTHDAMVRLAETGGSGGGAP
ncbi:MAG: efflux RND transporter periplasmic adaptor subunit [marine benthic group bacterium]|jgi:RND family efflux transporter MFP subunit|nr:efflux RND transporter periplasmic adaptor subunit [Candidatus Benthicola marisminoris]